MKATRLNSRPGPETNATSAARPRRSDWLARLLALLLPAGCGAPPYVETNPTWADVEPILRVQCNHCHGATADRTGSIAGLVYRFDFYDMTEEACGDASKALVGGPMAGAWAQLITDDITTPENAPRPRMPPAPASPLDEWERETLLRWAKNPVKGPMPVNDHEPIITALRMPAVVDTDLTFTVILDDPDRQAVVGVIHFADFIFKMNRAGAFQVVFDTKSVPAGTYRVTAVLCDGWRPATYDLGPITVRH